MFRFAKYAGFLVSLPSCLITIVPMIFSWPPWRPWAPWRTSQGISLAHPDKRGSLGVPMDPGMQTVHAGSGRNNRSGALCKGEAVYVISEEC